MIGFGALERGVGSVIFSDISQDLLDFCAEAARHLSVRDRCRFVRASADDLAGVESASVDAVTTRAVYDALQPPDIDPMLDFGRA